VNWNANAQPGPGSRASARSSNGVPPILFQSPWASRVGVPGGGWLEADEALVGWARRRGWKLGGSGACS
jgi:hypothetical protein